MELGTILLVCLFLLCVTEAVEAPYRALGIRPYAGAVLCLALLVLQAFPLVVTNELWLNPASLILLVVMGFLSIRHETYQFFFGTLLSVFFAFLAHLLFFQTPLPFEPGLWLGLFFGVCSMLLRNTPYTALFATVFSPLLFHMINAGREYLNYGYTVVSLGNSTQFGAQITGMLLSGCLLYLLIRQKTRKAMS